MTGAATLPPIGREDLDHAFHAVGEAGWRTLAGRRLFVTGGTGFIGKWLLSTLIDADRRLNLGCDIAVLSRDPAAFATSAPHLAGAPRVELLQGDVRDFAFPAGRFDVVVHGATDVVAQGTPLETFSTCVDGTKRALAFAAHSGATDFLLTSSGAIYGRQPDHVDKVPEGHLGGPDPTAPSSAYGEGKRVSEWLACAQGAETGLKVKIARIYAQVGPYLPLDKHFAIGNFMRDAMANRQIVIQGDGTPYRSYLHAADTSAWLWAMVIRGVAGRAWNVGGEEALSIAALARRVAAVLGSDAGARTLKTPAAGHVAEHYVPDVARARAELALPDPIPLDEAIARAARWYREHALTS